MERVEVNKLKELNIDIDTVDSLRSLYGMQDFEEEAIINVVKALRGYTSLCICKDCKNSDKDGCVGTTIYCRKIGAYRFEDDFCNLAEKEKSNEN